MMPKAKNKRPWNSHDGSALAPTTDAQRWQRTQIREKGGRCRIDRPRNIDWSIVTAWRFV